MDLYMGIKSYGLPCLSTVTVTVTEWATGLHGDVSYT